MKYESREVTCVNCGNKFKVYRTKDMVFDLSCTKCGSTNVKLDDKVRCYDTRS